MTLNILIDQWKWYGYRKRGGHVGADPPLLDVEQDVRDHENEVKAGNDYQIKAVDLCKTYPKAPRMSVCSNTFGARKGEVYGLLGPNGAGKSTTFNMISMQLPITSGHAELMGQEIQDFPLRELGKFFGQCN